MTRQPSTCALVLVGVLGGVLAGASPVRAQEPAPGVAPASPLEGAATAAAPGVAPASPLEGAAPARARAIAAPRPRVELDVELDVEKRRIGGTVRLTITNTSTVALTEVPLWLYPNRLAERDPALGDVNFNWFYPSSFSPALLTVRDVHLLPLRPAGAPGAGAPQTGAPQAGAAEAGAAEAGAAVSVTATTHATSAGPGTLVMVALPSPVRPGAAVALEVRFDTEIPHRLGAFGCVGPRCRLMGGYYPFAPALGPAGWQLDAPPPRVDVRQRVRVRARPGLTLVLDGTVARPGAAPVEAAATDVPYATLVTTPRLFESVVDAGGVRVRYLHGSRRPPSSSDEVLPYVREDRPGLVLDAAARGLRFLAAQGLPTPEPGAEILLVEAPLRDRLVEAHGRVVLVSDEIHRIFPAERVRKFHTFELLRGVFDARFDQALRGIEPDRDVELAADVLASYMLEVYALGRFHRIEYARDLLMPVDFIPAVDQLIYAPLVASSSTYFGDIDDRQGPRDSVRRFAADWPRGRFLYHKLLDLLGGPGMDRLARLMVGARLPLRAAASEVAGEDMAWFFAQWLGPLPRVNYRLVDVRREARPGGGEHVSIDVAREGADVREPVEVEVKDEHGGARTLAWTARGPRQTLEADLPAPAASVEVDPRVRLVESAVGSLAPTDDPRVDNRRPLRWRLLYDGFGALLNVTNFTANFFAAFTLKKQHELRNRLDMYAFHSESVQAGAGVSYGRFFGRQADSNRLASEAYASLTAARLAPSFGSLIGGERTPGWRLGVGVGVGHDDRDYIIDPWRAVGLFAGVSYDLTALDDGRRLHQISAGAQILRLIELRPGHVLALDLDGAYTVAPGGGLRLLSQLPRAGGPDGLRGYGFDELLGQGRLVGRLELRNGYVSDLSWNLLHLTVVRSIGGTFFFDAAAVASCGGAGDSGAEMYTDVGYSLRALHDAFGLHQQLFSIDVAVPLDRRERKCLGSWNQNAAGQVQRPRVVVLVTFLPSF